MLNSLIRSIHMKKLLFVIVLFVVFIVLILPSKSFAHVLETSGSVGAVIHVSPDDDPIAGRITDFFFDFKDKENKFKPNNCDCWYTITNSSGEEIDRQALFADSKQPSLTNASFSFTFPKKDVYTIKIIGKPLTPKAFEMFELTYNIRVARDLENRSSEQTETGTVTNLIGGYIPYIVGVGVIVGFSVFALKNQFKKRNTTK